LITSLPGGAQTSPGRQRPQQNDDDAAEFAKLDANKTIHR